MLKLFDSNTLYVTADEHFGHENIIEHCDRPYGNSRHMDGDMIRRFNSVVPRNGITIHNGDFGWLAWEHTSQVNKVLRRLNGGHILVIGNHDNLHPRKYLRAGFMSIHSTIISHDFTDVPVAIYHDPAVWNALNFKCVSIVGHIHNLFRLQKDKKMINVGVDVNDFKPLKLMEVIEEAK